MKKAYSIQSGYIEKIQYCCAVLIVCALLGYAYLLCSSVAFAVSQKDLAYKTAIVTDALAQLEAQYLSETQNLSKEMAVEKGLQTVESKLFVSASPSFSSAASVHVSN